MESRDILQQAAFEFPRRESKTDQTRRNRQHRRQVGTLESRIRGVSPRPDYGSLLRRYTMIPAAFRVPPTVQTYTRMSALLFRSGFCGNSSWVSCPKLTAGATEESEELLDQSKAIVAH